MILASSQCSAYISRGNPLIQQSCHIHPSDSDPTRPDPLSSKSNLPAFHSVLLARLLQLLNAYSRSQLYGGDGTSTLLRAWKTIALAISRSKEQQAVAIYTWKVGGRISKQSQTRALWNLARTQTEHSCWQSRHKLRSFWTCLHSWSRPFKNLSLVPRYNIPGNSRKYAGPIVYLYFPEAAAAAAGPNTRVSNSINPVKDRLPAKSLHLSRDQICLACVRLLLWWARSELGISCPELVWLYEEGDGIAPAPAPPPGPWPLAPSPLFPWQQLQVHSWPTQVLSVLTSVPHSMRTRRRSPSPTLNLISLPSRPAPRVRPWWPLIHARVRTAFVVSSIGPCARKGSITVFYAGSIVLASPHYSRAQASSNSFSKGPRQKHDPHEAQAHSRVGDFVSSGWLFWHCLIVGGRICIWNILPFALDFCCWIFGHLFIAWPGLAWSGFYIFPHLLSALLTVVIFWPATKHSIDLKTASKNKANNGHSTWYTTMACYSSFDMIFQPSQDNDLPTSVYI